MKDFSIFTRCDFAHRHFDNADFKTSYFFVKFNSCLKKGVIFKIHVMSILSTTTLELKYVHTF